MKARHVYSCTGIGMAAKAIGAARSASIADDDISLVARADIALDRIPDDRKRVMNDFYPAAMRGVAAGGASALLVGIVALITPIGLTIDGVGAMALVGATTGAWASALVGSSVPDEVHRQFADEIRAGKVLVVIDAQPDQLAHARHALEGLGAQPLDFQRASVLT